MRKLARAALSFSAAIFAANYILPHNSVRQLIILLLATAGFILMLGRKKLLSTGAILLFSAIGLCVFDWHYNATVHDIEKYSGHNFDLDAVVLSYPDIYDDYCRLEVRICSDDLPELRAYFYDNDRQLLEAKPGDMISFSAKLSAADTLYGKASRNYYANGIYMKLSSDGDIEHVNTGFGVAYLPQHISHYLSSRIENIFPADTQIFMRSLMLGDKTDFYGDEALYVAMSRAGLMHIVAVSGMHISYLLSLLYCFLGKGRRSAIICIGCVWLFALVAGATPSVVRAAFMCTTWLMAPVLQRENDAITSLSFILALLLCHNPFAAASLSLQLSFAAMAGIVLFGGKIYEALKPEKEALIKFRLVRGVLRSVSNSLAVMAFTIPLTAIHFGTVPLLAPVTNLLSIWAVSACFCGGWISCALSALPLLGEISAWICSLFARYIFLAAELISSVPFAVIYAQTRGIWLWIGMSYLFFALFALSKLRGFVRFVIPILMSILLLHGVSAYNYRDFNRRETINVLDVGQGQCISVLTDEVSAVFDCGNVYSIDNAGEIAAAHLYSQGRGEVDFLLLSHMHEDHANGASMLMEMIRVKTLIMPYDFDNNAKLYGDIIAAAKRNGTEIMLIDEDSSLSCGDINVNIFKSGESGEENERCLISRIELDGIELLITADATAKMQRQLTEKEDLSGVDVVVIPHHGSKYSLCEELLSEIRGDIALISVGQNYYGHPAEETLEALKRRGYNVYRTDTQGNLILRIG